MSLRKAIKARGTFPSEEAALKVMYLALRNVIKGRRSDDRMPARAGCGRFAPTADAVLRGLDCDLHQPNNLHLGLRKHRPDCLREAFQPINAGDERILHSAIVQLSEHL